LIGQNKLQESSSSERCFHAVLVIEMDRRSVQIDSSRSWSGKVPGWVKTRFDWCGIFTSPRV